MAETVIAETALEKDQQPTRYNYWMYQNYIIAEGIKNMGDALGRPEFSEYKEKQLMYFCDSYKKIKDTRSQNHYLKPSDYGIVVWWPVLLKHKRQAIIQNLPVE